MPVILCLALGGIILTIGDVVFKFWTEKSTPLLYVGGLAIYLVGLVFLVQSFKSQNIAIASTIFIIFNITTLLLVSWIYFDDKPTILQIVGFGVAIVAVVMLELAK